MENVKDKLKNEKYRNWVKSTLGIEYTGKALHKYVEEKFQLYTHGKLTLDGLSFLNDAELRHIRTGFCLLFNLNDKKKKRGKLNCPKCETSFEKILPLHTNPNRKNICWENNSSTGTSVEWAIAKMFMPHGNGRNNTGPETTDPLAIFELIKGCKLFKIDSTEQLDNLIGARNTLFHSSDNLVDENDMKNYFQYMEELLKNVTKEDKDVDQGIRDRVADGIELIKKLKDSEITIALFEDALKLKRKAIFEKCLSENDPDVLNEELELAANTVVEIHRLKNYADEEKYKEVIERCKTKHRILSNELAELEVIARRIPLFTDKMWRIRLEVNELRRAYRLEALKVEAVCLVLFITIITIVVVSLFRICLYFS